MRITEVEVDQLRPWESNPRVYEHAVGPVAESIRRFGFNVPLVCNRELRIIAGHTRWMAAKQLGLQKVPVVQINLKENEEAAFSIAENKTGELADWNTGQLSTLLNELNAEDVDLRRLGFSSLELRKYLGTGTAPEERDTAPPKRRRISKGEVWKLGMHRLICGDSRHKKTVYRLLGNERMDHVFTGPPYFDKRGWSVSSSSCLLSGNGASHSRGSRLLR
jgi:ParB-like chromosome segregation protein Spo0J